MLSSSNEFFHDKQTVKIDGNSFICISWNANFDTFGKSNIIHLHDEEYQFQGIAETEFIRILNLLDGRRNLKDIANKLDLSVSLIIALCEQLVRYRLAVNCIENDNQQFTSAEFVRLCRHLFPIWKAKLFSHSLWVSLVSGTAEKTVFIGWLIENYHLISAVNDRLALAIAECREIAVRDLFIHHYIEEWNHNHFFMKALNHFGLDRETVLSSRPIPGTLAIINSMRRAARNDPLSYVACSGFLESTGEDRVAGRNFFQLLIEHYSLDNPSAIRPLVEHLNLDEAYGHNGLFEKICIKTSSLTVTRASMALQSAFDLVEALELWSTDIMRTYKHLDPFCSKVIRQYRSSQTI